MKKKLVLIISVVVLAAFAIGGTTYALFTDTASVGKKTFMTGTLDIDTNRAGLDTIPGPMFYTNPIEGKALDGSPGLKPTGLWAPGDLHIRTLVVQNRGSLDAVLDSVKAELVSDPTDMAADLNVKIFKVLPLDCSKFGVDEEDIYLVDFPGDDSLPLDFAELLAVKIHNAFAIGFDAIGFEYLVQKAIENNLDINPIWEGRLSQLTDGYKEFSEKIQIAGTSRAAGIARGCLLAFAVELDYEDAGNEQQGARSVFGFTIKATNAVNDFAN
jgi:predicted ribosomally synthesized peptide with SipW-like signal peptide